MERHDLAPALAALGTLRVTQGTTDADAMDAMRPLASFNQCTLGLVRFTGETPWERHPGGDELLQVLEGTVEVTVLEKSGPASITLATGSLFVVPSGLWHRQHARATVTLLFATPVEGGETSWETPEA